VDQGGRKEDAHADSQPKVHLLVRFLASLSIDDVDAIVLGDVSLPQGDERAVASHDGGQRGEKEEEC